MKIDLSCEIKKCNETISNAHKLHSQLVSLVAFFNDLPSLRYCYFYPADAKIIVGVKTRDDLAAIRLMHKGVWEKQDATFDIEDTLKYIATVNGIIIDVRINELPPSCKVIEEEVTIPEHKETRRKIVCNEPLEQDAENGKPLPMERVQEPVEY